MDGGAVQDHSGAQSGDHTSRDVAGGNISTNDPGPWLSFLAKNLEQYHGLTRDVEYVSDQVAAFQIMVSRRFEEDSRERDARRRELDARLDALERRERRMFTLAIGVAVFGILVTLALVRHELALFTRAVHDVYLV